MIDPIDFTFPTRSEIIERYQRDHKLRNPDAATGPGTQPYLDAVLLADQLMPVIAYATKAGRAIQLEGKSIEQLQTLAAQKGVDLAGDVGSTGYVTIRASAGGTTILSGDECTDQATGLRFRCSATDIYADGDDVPLAGIDTGPATNLDDGTVLQWTSPRAGCAPTCTVAAQSDGSGLSGGAEAEGREQVIAKIIDAQTNPEAAGNAADYRATIKRTPGIQVEEAFVYPSIGGPTLCVWTFTVPPNKYGSRIPSAAQAATVAAHVTGAMPLTDLHGYAECEEDEIDVSVEVTWGADAYQWANEAPWPDYLEDSPSSGSGAVEVGTVTSATEFQLVTSNADYTTCGDPAAGTVIAFWDAANRKFVRKTALTVTGSGPWDIVCDTSFDASDKAYVPTTGQRAMPWSRSLELLVAPVVAFFEGIGPGPIDHEVLDGRRGERVPADHKSWPSRTTKRLELDALTIDAVASGDFVEGANVAAASTSFYPKLLTLGDFAVFPE